MKRLLQLNPLNMAFLAFVLLFGTGLSHEVMSMPAGHAMEKETTQCQSICPPVLSDNQRTPEADKDDAYPDPLAFRAPNLAAYFSYMSAILLALLAYCMLIRRPPDLQVAYSLRRI